MAKISKKEVEHIARLARIDLSKKEKVKFEKELSSILEFVSKLQEVDPKNIEPLSQVTGLENVLEDDEIKNQPNRKELLKNAPQKQDGFIKVKKVFEEEDVI